MIESVFRTEDVPAAERFARWYEMTVPAANTSHEIQNASGAGTCSPTNNFGTIFWKKGMTWTLQVCLRNGATGALQYCGTKKSGTF